MTTSANCALATSADLLLDTSAAVPFLVTSHVEHASTFGALSGRRLGLSGHAAFETFSVITRLPEPARVSPATAVTLLRRNFPHTKHLGAPAAGKLIARFAESRIAGGAVYDAMVAACALDHGCVLATRDERALTTYASLGVEVLLLP